MKEKIKVGICVAYDWYLLKYSLPLIYEYADKICLSIDIDKKSWNNLSYSFNEEEFNKLVSGVDKDGKVEIYRDNFHLSNLSPMQNEVRQRNLMAVFMGKGGWHIQLDADEYFIQFEQLVKFLRSLPLYRTKKVNICCPIYNIFKKVEHGFLLISAESTNSIEYATVATRDPYYEYGRKNYYFNMIAPFPVLHQSWCRSEEEIQSKLDNWGHVGDYEPKEFFRFWKSLDNNNYKNVKNFHPIQPDVWSGLSFVKGDKIEDIINMPDLPIKLPPSGLKLAIRNSKNFSRVRSIFTKINKLIK